MIWNLSGPGTVSSTGLYTAPANLGNATSATVTATSAVDATAQAFCKINLKAQFVTISPSSASITAGSTEQFSAKVTGVGNTSVKWTLSGPGTISAGGLYTAPASVTGNASATITATSVAVPSLTSSATVTITAPQPISISPGSVSIYAGQTQQFSATLAGTATNAVTWSLSGSGTLSNAGLYTAPDTVTANITATVTATSTADTSMTSTATITVSPQIITVAPATVSLYPGAKTQFSAKLLGGTDAVSWSLSGPGTLSTTGLYTAPAKSTTTQTATITASTKKGVKGHGKVNIQAQTISVNPTSMKIYAGGNAQFSATLAGVTDQTVNWSVSGPGSISNSGMYSAPASLNSSTTATITASSAVVSGLQASATVTVNPQSISISPTSASLQPGGTKQFSASLTGVSDNSVTWSVSGPGSISNSGLYTAPASVTSATSATITATSNAVNSLQASATVNISASAQNISISPTNSTLTAGGTQQFSASVSGPADTSVTWSVSGPGSISTSGLYTAPATVTSATTATITATSNAVSSLKASATVTLAAETISITPTSASLAAGGSQQFSATVSGASDTSVTWSVSGPGSISNSGLYSAPATVTSPATATITATSNASSSLKASATVSLAAETISINPTSASLAAGGSQQFSATVSGASDTSVTWSVSGPGSISNSGLYSAPATVTSQTTATITATSNASSSLKASATVTLAAQTISISPTSKNLNGGDTAQFTATVSGGSDTSVTWSVSGPGSISNSGLYTAPASVPSATSATITATSNASSSLKASATVNLAAQSISVSPASANVSAGGTAQFTAKLAGVSDTSVTWSVSGPGSVSNSGLYTAPATVNAATTATVIATSNAVGSLSDSATVNIAAPTISVSPSSTSVAAGGTAQFSATLTGVSDTSVTWSVSGGGTISSSGLYKAASNAASGSTATITATSNAVSSLKDTATVTIKAQSISITPTSSTLYENGTTQFNATVSGVSDTSVTWSLSGPGTISSGGLYTAPSSVSSTTTATVTATSNAVGSLNTSVTVTLKPSTISVSPASASINAGQTKQFSATLTGVTDNTVTWSVSGSGSINTSGLYSAPSSVSTATTSTITATSNADNSLVATASITVNPASSNPTGTAITACGQNLQANTTYYLANDIGSSASSLCLTPTGPNLVLNLNGHKITGTLKSQAINPSGVHIYNGSITCSDSDPNQPGCLYIGVDTDSPAISVPMEVDHISWINNSATSNNSERNMMIDFGGFTKTAISGPNVLIHDNTSVSATGISSSRIVNLQVQATAHSNIAYAAFYNNATLCQSTAAACQGVVAYGLWNVKVYNNTFVNQMANANSTETPRAVICDQTDGCEIYSNTFDAEDGRAVRMRGTNNKNDVNSVHDNIVNNVKAGSNGNEVAAFHIGDPDSGTEVENATIYNNTINATTGWVFMARSATAITIRDNALNTNTTVNLLDARSVGAATGVLLDRTTITGGSAMSFCESGVSATVCKSGNVSGSCSMNNNGC